MIDIVYDMGTTTYQFLKNRCRMIKWHKNMCFDMLLFDKFTQMLSVVDFIAFAANSYWYII